MLIGAVAFSDLVLAVHILGAVIGFGVVFAFPLLWAVAGRTDPAVIPWLLRARKSVGRYLVNPGLTLVVLAGIYLATDEHYWGSFFVGWGIFAALVIGAVEGSYIIKRAEPLAELAERDLAATAVPAGGQRTSATWSREYTAAQRRFVAAGNLMALIVIVTVFLMATHAGS
jgi:hypothetical protein